jgi:hypothetical protein
MAVGDEVAEFVRDLQRLRYAAGEPSYSELAKRTGFPRSTLHGALRGDRLPPLELVRAVVGACGGDPREWDGRWLRLREARDGGRGAGAGPAGAGPSGAREAAASPPGDADVPGISPPVGVSRTAVPPRSWRTPALVVAAAVLAAAVATTTEVLMDGGHDRASRPTSCSRQREYRVRRAGALLDRAGRPVGAVSAGDLVDAADLSTGPYAHRYYVTNTSRGERGYVDQAKIHFVREVCR